jgi:hypothetical protein
MNGRAEPQAPNGYLSGFSVGHLAFFYWGHELRRSPRADVSQVEPYLSPVWPATGVVKWPPPRLLEADGVDFVTTRFPIKGWI